MTYGVFGVDLKTGPDFLFVFSIVVVLDAIKFIIIRASLFIIYPTYSINLKSD